MKNKMTLSTDRKSAAEGDFIRTSGLGSLN